MYKFIYRNIIFPFGTLVKGREILGKYKFLRKQEYKNRKDRLKTSFKDLRRILLYSYENVPYYHKIWKKINFNPNQDFSKIEDMKKIPPLKKEHIRNNLEELKAISFSKKIVKNFSGGSTGEPLVFYVTRESKNWGTANIYRHYSMCNCELGDKHAFLWGADRDAPNSELDMKIRRFRWYNSFNLSNEKMLSIYGNIKKFKPKLLIAYPSSLYQFVLFLEEKNLRLNLPAIQSSAEKLYSFQRKKFNDTLNCQVFDRYGCREVGNIAHECSEHDKLHVSQDLIHVDIVDSNDNTIGYDESGLVTLTDLHNFGMPFIKYQNEDIASLSDEDCSCGRTSYLLKPLIGRTSDNILTQSGQIIHGEFFTHLFYNKPQIKQFQIIQEKIDSIKIFIIPNSSYENFDFTTIVREIETEITNWIKNDNLVIELSIVDKIETTKTGKHRFTYSKIWQDYLAKQQ